MHVASCDGVVSWCCVYGGVWSILYFETRCTSSATSQIQIIIQWWVHTVLFVFHDFFWRSYCCNTAYDRMFEALLWLFPPAWNAVKFTLIFRFICPLVVIDPTDLGATIVVAHALYLTIFNLFPPQNTCLFTDDDKSDKLVCVCVCVCMHVLRKAWNHAQKLPRLLISPTCTVAPSLDPKNL